MQSTPGRAGAIIAEGGVANALLVGENSVRLDAARLLLSTLGHSVFDAEGGGSQVLDLIDSIGMDIAFVDVSTDNVDGLEMIKALSTVHPDLGVVAIVDESGDSGSRVWDAVRSGALHVVPVPFGIRDLSFAISKALAQAPVKGRRKTA